MDGVVFFYPAAGIRHHCHCEKRSDEAAASGIQYPASSLKLILKVSQNGKILR